MLQKRVDELETRVKKLEDEKANLKQDNASLVSNLPEASVYSFAEKIDHFEACFSCHSNVHGIH